MKLLQAMDWNIPMGPKIHVQNVCISDPVVQSQKAVQTDCDFADSTSIVLEVCNTT